MIKSITPNNRIRLMLILQIAVFLTGFVLIMNPDDEGVVAVVEEVERTIIYKSSEDFMNNSVHLPRQIPEDARDIELNKQGELYV